ncbi:hypothetical protein L6452_22431 [Arctium lappa]|uniref:Uncharacterized protein n=1 Tax=Arctium lappa TaxID=4217 RepID=A0ACB9B0P9_ARCLA|nr:hypothetical protein L6452_22431 [Arctium lappa]
MNPVPKSITVDISELSPITETTSLPRCDYVQPPVGRKKKLRLFSMSPVPKSITVDISELSPITETTFFPSKLGVPIKTTIPANVLEEALNGTVTVRPLPIGTSASGKLLYFEQDNGGGYSLALQNPNTIVRCLPHPAVISLSVVYRQFQFLLSDLASLIVF